jgi:membrane fusion protein (multidrug efflux system)
VSANDSAPIAAKIVAIDARVDPTTRNATVRARVSDAERIPAPGASVRVLVPAGPEDTAVGVPVSALRKGPAGDHVFVIAADSAGKTRASIRQVRAGTVEDDTVLIQAGLKPGEVVATSGSFKLRDAVLVAVANDSAAVAGRQGN